MAPSRQGSRLCARAPVVHRTSPGSRPTWTLKGHHGGCSDALLHGQAERSSAPHAAARRTPTSGVLANLPTVIAEWISSKRNQRVTNWSSATHIFFPDYEGSSTGSWCSCGMFKTHLHCRSNPPNARHTMVKMDVEGAELQLLAMSWRNARLMTL